MISFDQLPAVIAAAPRWFNDNSGFASLLMFAATAFFGWVTGIFRALQVKPKFKIDTIPGPTFSCTYLTGEKYGEYDVHRTGVALYLHITNLGSASSSIRSVQVGYHWALKGWSWKRLRYGIGWHWLTEQAVALDDFQVSIGEMQKCYPFLFQRSTVTGWTAETFLQIGQSTNGVVYFEQDDSFGGFYPLARDGMVVLKIRVVDAFGRRHSTKVQAQAVTLVDARRYNPSFGATLAELRAKPLPSDEVPVADATQP